MKRGDEYLSDNCETNDKQNLYREIYYIYVLLLVMSNEFSIFVTASACVAFIDQQMNGQPIATQRLPVAMETLDEPLYVNAKQYHRIIKRRQARAKLEAEGKIPKARKVSFCGLFIFKAKEFLVVKKATGCCVSKLL